MSERLYDVVLFGATGYTGRLASQYLATKPHIRFAIAGRSESRLRALRRSLAHQSIFSAKLKKADDHDDDLPETAPTSPSSSTRETGPPSTGPPTTASPSPGSASPASASVSVPAIEIATSGDELTALAGKTRVMVSCAGPYSVCGESVVSACIAGGCDYLDITAELPWVDRMNRLHHEAARAKGLKLVMCCGFDFVPNDMMLFQAREHLDEAERASGETFVITSATHSFAQSTPWVSGGTAYSGMELFNSHSLLDIVPYHLNPYAMCSAKTEMAVHEVAKDLNRFQLLPQYVHSKGYYCTPFVMSNLMHKFVHWSNQLQQHRYGLNIVYLGGEKRASPLSAFAFAVIIWIQFFSALLLSRLPLTLRRHFLPYPGDGCDIDPETAFMTSSLTAALASSEADATKDPLATNGSVTVEWNLQRGEAYLAAAIFVVEGALTLIATRDQTPDLFGVLSPAAALGRPYLDRLKTCDRLGMNLTFNH